MSRSRVAVVALAAVLPCLVLVGKYPLDLEVYRAGGRAVLAGTPVYDARVHGYGFTYPPFAALLFTGWTVLSLPVATVGITLLSLVAVAAILRMTCRGLLDAGWPGLILVAGLASCGPVRGTMWNGQVNLVLAALVLADVLGVTPSRWRGALIGLAAAIKLTPLIFVPYLLLCGRVADARRAVVSFVVVGAVSWLVLPDDSLRFWRHQLLDGAGIGDPARMSNQSLRGMALRLIGPMAAGLAWPVLAAVVVVVGLRLAVRIENPLLSVGIVGVVGCLVSPVSWMHHWVWCVPCIAGLAETRVLRPAVLVPLSVVSSLDLLPAALTQRWPVTSWILGNGYVLTALVLGALGWRAHFSELSARHAAAVDVLRGQLPPTSHSRPLSCELSARRAAAVGVLRGQVVRACGLTKLSALAGAPARRGADNSRSRALPLRVVRATCRRGRRVARTSRARLPPHQVVRSSRSAGTAWGGQLSLAACSRFLLPSCPRDMPPRTACRADKSCAPAASRRCPP